MSNDIVSIVLSLGAFVTALTAIITALKKVLKVWLDNNVNNKIETSNNNLKDKIDTLDVLICKLHIIDFLSDIENGVEKDDEQIRLAYEMYDHYTDDLKQNSYVHDKWNKVMNIK